LFTIKTTVIYDYEIVSPGDASRTSSSKELTCPAEADAGTPSFIEVWPTLANSVTEFYFTLAAE